VAHQPGQIIVLNGVPRSGKSSIAAAIQATFDGLWMNLGVDGFKKMTPARYQPGIGLRPGGERPDLEPLVQRLYAAMYESIAAHSRLGLNVVVDVGHHDAYAAPRGILADCARRLRGLPALFVGVRCPVEVIMERRRATGYNAGGPADPIPEEVLRWQAAVHTPGIYDLEVDTSLLSPEACAELIRQRLERGPPPSAFERLAAMAPDQAAARVRVVPPDPAWSEVYQSERAALTGRVGELFVALEHIGSTAVPGLEAKPVIDMMAAVRTLEDGERAAELLRPLGYQPRETGMPRRIFLQKQDGQRGLRFHLHIVEHATWGERNERLLRDYLLAHPEDAAAYGALKRALAEQYADDPDGYTRAKTAFIQEVVDRARRAAGLPPVPVWEE